MKKRLIILILFVGYCVGCSKKEVVSTQQWISHGDPIELIRGMETNKGTDSIPSGFSLSAMSAVEEMTFLNKSIAKSYDLVIKEQDPYNTRGAMLSGMVLQSDDSFESEVEEKIETLYFKKRNGVEFRIDFLIQGDSISVFKIYYNQKRVAIDFRSVHLSLHSDGQSMSILFYWKDADSLRLTTLFFANPIASTVDKLNSRFYYMTGAGRGVRWNKKIALKQCGNFPKLLSDVVFDSSKIWAQQLSDQTVISTSSEASESCPPFSDLNFQGSYYIKNFRTTGGDDYLNPAFVLSQTTGHIIDADVFSLDEELKKNFDCDAFLSFSDCIENFNNSNTNIKVSATSILKVHLIKTYVHELGHVLGLGHNFSGEESIMSYQNMPIQFPYISKYDKEAIQELYKK